MPIRINIKPDSKSTAEWAIFRIAQTLGPAWDVWMNRHLVFTSRTGGAINHEVDCILYHRDYGMLIVECKGARIWTKYNEETRETEWYSGKNRLNRSPGEQVSALIAPLHEYMKEILEPAREGRMRKVRVQWAVCFSDMDSMEGIPSSEIPRKRALLRPDVINAKRFEKRLVEILETPVQANGNMPFMNEYLDEDSLFRLRNFLDGQGEKPDAGEIIKSTYENCFEEATEMQQMMMESISRNPRMRIEGVAGSGKSHMVVWDALRLSRIGKNVAIACYNDLLATELKQDVDKVISNDRIGVEKKYAQDGGVSYGRVDVYAYSEWCEKYVRAAKLKVDKSGDRSQYFDRELPQAFVKAQKILAKDKKKREKFFYDAVIIDEGQDFASEWVDGFIGLLHNQEHGIVRFFYDPAQRLYASRNGIDNAQVESMPVMVLNRGFRSTKRILEWVRKNTGFRLQAFDNIVLGDAVKEMHYRDGSEQAQMLSARIDELMEKKKLSVSDILVVSMKSDRNSALRNLTDERLVWNTSGDKSLVKDKINIVSVYRIKGLDATAVILADLEEPVEASKREDWKRCMLVGATRAKALLTVFRKG
jgi:hypothetical protein